MKDKTPQQLFAEINDALPRLKNRIRTEYWRARTIAEVRYIAGLHKRVLLLDAAIEEQAFIDMRNSAAATDLI